jgi:hypothetical protein
MTPKNQEEADQLYMEMGLSGALSDVGWEPNVFKDSPIIVVDRDSSGKPLILRSK